MSEKKEIPWTSKSIGAAAATTDYRERVGSSDEGNNSSSGHFDLRFKQNSRTDLLIWDLPSMSTRLRRNERTLSNTPLRYPKSEKEKYDTFLEEDQIQGVDTNGVIAIPRFPGLFSPVQGPYGMTHHQVLALALAQAVQANANMQPHTKYPPSSLVQSFSSGQSQIPSSALDSSLLAQSDTSDITTIEHRSQQPLNVEKRDDDGYNWRKYGQKQVTGYKFHRSYYKCTNPGCPSKKKVERSLDGQVREIIYKGNHSHKCFQNTKREDKDTIANLSGSSELAASLFQTSSSKKTKREQHEVASLATTTECMSEASDNEEVDNGETGVREKYEDEPDPKRRITEVRVSEPAAAASHRTVTEPRIIVQATSEADILDDGYRWRKYGQKDVKGNPYPRIYYKCTTQGCSVRKQVERAATDPKAVVTTYEGKHNHVLSAAKSSSHDASSNVENTTEAFALKDHANTTLIPSFGKAPLETLKTEVYENTYSFASQYRADFGSFPPRSSKILLDAALSIGFRGSQSIFVDVASPDTSDGVRPLSTCGTFSASKDYDVVIRYEREDKSIDNFISHLRASLCRRRISVYEEFNEVDAVPECRVLIILLTSTYVPSNLLNILEHQHTQNGVVYPVFYKLSPYDFVCNSKNYERFFLQDEPKRWQAALKEITEMPGYTLTDKSETELIDEIVRDALKALCSGDKVNMIGMDMQVEEILSLLCINSLDVRSIGIWGMVGIGKTTIAEEIFRRISVQYETCVFLKDLHKEVEVKGHDAVREGFLSKVLEVEPHVIWISDIKTSFLRSRLQRKKVLIILDDVNDYRDVETFLGKLNYFGPGSRIIMTSRNRRVFVLCKIDNVYEVKPLDISKSLLLLERGTSQSILLPGPNRTLSLELVKFSNGNPQVLQFLSSSYREWSTLSREVQKTFPIYIPGIFERICCGLDDNERSIFLDIACFFRRMDKDNVAMLLDGCGFSAHVGFRSLVDKSLLTISYNMVDMLRFIQATGRAIVRQESADKPGDRSRLWNTKDIMDVFVDDTGTSAVEGIFLDMLNVNFDANSNVFEKMCNLRLLKLYCSKIEGKHGVSFPQGLEYLPSKLRLLHWEYYPLSSLPKSFNPENLVELNLSSSCATKLWKGKKNLEKLKRMKLSYSYQLCKIPRLSSAPNLELLDLEGCNSLVNISQSICCLKKLVSLNLKDCLNLESIPYMVDLESLEVLNLSGCSKLENFPEISPNVKEIYMGGTMIQEIPSSIKNLVLLKKLDLENSKHLKNLPTSICKLKHLETLNLSGCTSLERFPDLSRKMKCLRFLDLSRTAIKELPSSISYLTALEELRSEDCKNMVRLPIVKSRGLTRSIRNLTELNIENFSIPVNKKGLDDGMVENKRTAIYRSLGVSGPDDFAISYDAWEASKIRSLCHIDDIVKSFDLEDHKIKDLDLSEAGPSGVDDIELTLSDFSTPGDMELVSAGMVENKCGIERTPTIVVKARGYLVSNDAVTVGGGIKGVRPLVLKPPPSMKRPPIDHQRSIITSWQKGQLLGRGSFGSVYEGISGDGDFFAVKEVSLLDLGFQAQECIHQIEEEIAILSKLQHQNIVRYRGTAKDASNLYIFLELVTQGSLLKLYHVYQQLQGSAVSGYTRQILDGLKYLHDSGFGHRNIKCANILVDANGSVKLSDFGLVKVSKLNDLTSCKGPPNWMAPEVIKSMHNDEYGRPADIWSLGCTVLEMLTGQIPYFNLEPVQALFNIVSGKLPEIPDTLSLDARHFILKCLKVNPYERPTAAELLNHPFVRRSLPSLGSSSGSGSASPFLRR